MRSGFLLEPETGNEGAPSSSQLDGAPGETPPVHAQDAAGVQGPLGAKATPGVPVLQSRAGRAWWSVVPALVAAAVMLVFVFQNRQDAKVSFLAWSGRFPLALALLVAAALGALVVFGLGSVRILQLRKAVRHRHGLGETTPESR